jgi:hypothetical protein
MAETLWDVDTDYREVVRDLCTHFFGPVADEMVDYTMKMEEAIRQSVAWRDEGWSPLYHQDIPLELLVDGRGLLKELAQRVEDDPVFRRRVAYARLGHAQLIFIQTRKTKTPTAASRDLCREAFDETNDLRAAYGLVVKRPTADLLRKFDYPPIVE